MWKKFLVVCVCLVGTFSIVYANENGWFSNNVIQANGKTSNGGSYIIGDKFEGLNKSTFTMGGLEWRIIYTNNNQGYIMSAKNATDGFSPNFQCPGTIRSLVYHDNIATCMNTIQNYYTTQKNNSDRIGKIIQNINSNLNTIGLLSEADYNIVANEKNATTLNQYRSFIDTDETWLGAKDSHGNHILFYGLTTSDAGDHWGAYKHLYEIYSGSTSYAASTIYPVFKVNLPEKGALSSIEYQDSAGNKQNNIILYANTEDIKAKATIPGSVVPIQGEGTFEYSIVGGTISSEDVMSDGTKAPTGETLSTSFEINSNDNGKITIGNQNLEFGTYYVKVQIKDTTTNNKIYYSEDDPYRIKSVVIKIEVKNGIEKLKYTSIRDGISGTDIQNIYISDNSGVNCNVNANDVLGNFEITNNTTNTILFDIVSSYDQIDSSYKDIAIDSSNKKVIAKDRLKVGVYKFRIRAYTSNGTPANYNDGDSKPINQDYQGINNVFDQAGQPITYGFISDEITFVVYPSSDYILYQESMDDNGTVDDLTDDRHLTKSEIDKNTKLASLKFSEDAKINSLYDSGFKITLIELKAKGTSNALDNFYFEEDENSENSYILKWNDTKSLPVGKTEFDIYIHFDHNDKNVAVIKKEELLVTIYDTFDLTKLKWQKKDTVPQSFTDVQGTINTSGINSNELSVGYVSQGSFYTQISQLSGYTKLTDAKIEYSLKAGSTAGIISVATNGKVTILKTSPENADVKIQAKITKDGFQDAYVYLPVKITQGQTTFSYVDQNGSQLPMVNDKYKPYQVDGKNVVYNKEGKIQLYTSGNPNGTEVTYKLKDENIKDVIEVDSKTGEITILNANTSLQKDKVIVIATAHDPNGNYADVSIELPINIDKAKQTISFVENPINVANGKGKVVPEVKDMDISSNNGGTQISDTKYMITIDDSTCPGCAHTSDGKEIQYEYEGDEGVDITLKVSKQGNRNYENVGPVETILHITGKEEALFEVSNPSKITYGDHFTIQSLQDDSGSTDVKYEFTLDSTTYIKQNDETLNDGTGEFDAIKASGTNSIEITVKRTATGELPITKKLVVKVLPKDIKIKINDQEKLKGEENPSLTYQSFDTQLVSWNGTQDVIQVGDVKLSTTANATSAAGGYPITGDGAYLNKTYPNYNFTFTNGTLKVNEEVIEDNWYHLELDDGKNTSYSGKWTNKDVNIITDHDEYVNISKDQSTWSPNKVTVNTEGKTEQSFWLKKDSGAITGEKKEIILIDKTPPTLKSVSAKDSRNQLQILISNLSSGFFFRPNTTFKITTSDVKEKLEVSGTSSIDYKIYDQDKKLIKQDSLSVTNEKASITIQETTGTYQLCMILKDQAGNETDEICKTVDLKEIGQDSDGDGIPDINIDTDGDGKPDLNITKKQCDDLDEDKECKLPYLNIDTVVSPEDTKGNGHPDMNIDTDGDGKPDLNTGIVKEWKPDTLVDLDGDGKPDYKTDSTLKGLNNIDTDGDQYPDLNIDQNLDGIPELNINTDGKLDKPQTNIDGNGDGKPNINIDENGDGTPEKNVMDILEWKPEHNVTQDGKVIYDTMKIEYKAVDELEDNGIKVKPSDPDTSFLPNMALKVDDITSNTSEDTKKDILKDSGETDKEVKKVYDVKLLEDNKEIQPNGSLKVSIPVDEAIQNAKVMMKAKDGTWKVMDVKVENGYYVFETDYIGEVSVIGDPETTDVKDPKPTPIPTPSNNNTQTNTSKPPVQGNYTRNTGGASTGDTSNLILYFGMCCFAFGLLTSMMKKS